MIADDVSSAPLKVFISYARRDSGFVDRLAAALKVRGVDVLIDRQDLPKLEDWERELLGFIRAADTIVFVVSRRSLASKVVGWEIEQVRSHHKRLAPVVIEDVQNVAVPPDIARINYLYFTDDASFETSADELVRALNTDVAWLKEHTRLGEAARRWIERGRPQDALLRGRDLNDAEAWAARPRGDAPVVMNTQREFLVASRSAEAIHFQRERRQRRLRLSLALVLVVLCLGIATYWVLMKLSFVESELAHWADVISPKTLSVVAERALQPGARFSECRQCPEMVLVPAGRYLRGSPATEKGRTASESPLGPVTIARSFAVSRYAITFDEWDACVAMGGCSHAPYDHEWGHRNQPVIDIDWNDARQYAAWLSRVTGKSYRLLSEAEWEYAARAGTRTAYFWGDDVGAAKANCNGCGSPWDNKRTAPVGSFEPNGFGLFDVHGNSWTWTQDCWHDSYVGAPSDGSAWTDNCTKADQHAVRGGSWDDDPANIRSGSRFGGPSDARNAVNGVRIGRTIRP